MNTTELNPADTSRIIEMAWEDRTPFEAIQRLYGQSEKQVIALMRHSLSVRAFKNWRQRVTGRKTKHAGTRPEWITRSHCKTQYKIRGNR